jgi:hypothetical protein
MLLGAAGYKDPGGIPHSADSVRNDSFSVRGEMLGRRPPRKAAATKVLLCLFLEEMQRKTKGPPFIAEISQGKPFAEVAQGG